MKKVTNINDYQAVIHYDPEIELFRGEFIRLNGGADFYANSVEELHREAEQSLSVFLAVCTETGILPTNTTPLNAMK